MSISEQKQDLQIQTSFKYRKKRAIDTFEEATEKGKYDYWLTQEDIADIARIEYNYFRDSSVPGLGEFEILGSLLQLNSQLERFQSTQQVGGRLTLIINLNDQHWVTLVIKRGYLGIDGIYVDSKGRLLPDEYYVVLQKFNVILNDFSLHFVQQTDDYNCGLWALENANDINQMLTLNESLNWLTYQLKFPRNLFYFKAKRQGLLFKFYLDVIRRGRIRSNRLPVESELPQKNDIYYGLETNEPTPKRVKVQALDKAKVEAHLEKFVGSFIAYFQQKIAAYHLIARGEKLTIPALTQELKIGTTGALFGLVVSRSLTGLIPSFVASLRTVSSRYYLPKNKVQTVTRFFSEIQSEDLSNILAEAAVEIFRSYEMLFMQVTDKGGAMLAMEKLAEDAVDRSLNFISENDALIISAETISKGVIFGISDKYFDPNLKKFRLSSSGNAIQDHYENKIYTADIYDKVGLVIFIADSARFYKKIGISTETVTQYGYRRALSWEKTRTSSLIEDYAQNYEPVTLSQIETGLQRDLQKYEYTLNSVVTQQKAQDIILKIIGQHHAASLAKPNIKKSIIFDLRKPVKNFVGRMAALDALHKTLLAGNMPTIISAMSSISLNSSPSTVLTSGPQTSVSGLGGIGKTQLVLRYAQLHAADYDNNVLWINSETKADLSRSFLKLATKLAIETRDRCGEDKAIESIIEEIYEYFSNKKSLFIFDNVENYQDIELVLPKLMLGNKPHILITSRYSHWKNVANVISLDVFTEQEALALVKHGLSINTSSQDSKIIELNTLVQGLPLALQQAIAYIQNQKNSNSEFTVEDYIQIFKKKVEKY